LPSAHRPVSAMCMTSAPLSVSWSWAMSTSPGPMPAASNAACAASTDGLGARSGASHELKTSKDPNRLERTTVERTYTDFEVYRDASSARQTTSAAPPSPGEQNMYCVSGSLSIVEPSISASVKGVRRHAFGFSAPLRYDFAATFDRMLGEIAWSCR